MATANSVFRDACDPPSVGPCQAEGGGFSLHAGVVIPAGRRARLEQVCRYLLRPPVAGERLQVTDAGQVCLSLRHPWRDGTTAFVFDPVAFLGRLAVLVPRPRVNLVLYYGVLGARSAWRAAVVRGASPERDADHAGAGPAGAAASGGSERGVRWAALMARTFGVDVLACPRCGGRLRLVALIEQPAVSVGSCGIWGWQARSRHRVLAGRLPRTAVGVATLTGMAISRPASESAAAGTLGVCRQHVLHPRSQRCRLNRALDRANSSG